VGATTQQRSRAGPRESHAPRTIGVFGTVAGPAEVGELKPSIARGWIGMGLRTF
jgi:hypothetical protein